MSEELLNGYIRSLVNRFFKILPIRESGSEFLSVYMSSLQAELAGCRSFIDAINNDPAFISLVSILQYLIDNPDCPIPIVKREVFRAISICNKLVEKYSSTDLQEEVLSN